MPQFDKSTSSWWTFYIVLIAITLAISLYCLGDLSWHLKKQYFFGDVFWDMWLKLKHGEFTADRHIIYEEAMVIAGKTYAYFLPFPALVRGFFSIFKLGQYPIPSVLLAITIFLMSALSLYRELIILYSPIGLAMRGYSYLVLFVVLPYLLDLRLLLPLLPCIV